ncbi:unnamed protein product [Lasius platythorax]|uniref:Uncharacterized protein n=1 Tax=Lasius platythorax TaxID=488582 RepID=A0AAV2NNL7_9HYME
MKRFLSAIELALRSLKQELFDAYTASTEFVELAQELPEDHSINSMGQLPWPVWHCPASSRNATCSPSHSHISTVHTLKSKF